MGVEYILYREDTKTAFDFDKGGWFMMADLAFDPERLLEHLLLNCLHWEGGVDPAYVLLLRDRILDFVEGAKPSQVKCVSDSFWYDIDDRYEYNWTHDRFCTDADIDIYRKHLDDQRYLCERKLYDPVESFRTSGASRGRYVDENQERQLRWRELEAKKRKARENSTL